MKDSGKDEGSVVMFRPFGDDANYAKVDESFKAWIENNERPIVLPFDERTISSVFHQGKDAVCFFNSKDSKETANTFKEAAEKYTEEKSDVKFTEINVFLNIYFRNKANTITNLSVI